MAKETFSSLIDLFKTTSASTVNMECTLCGNKLGVFRRKKLCAECRRLFCNQCVGRCQDRALRCKNCYILTMRPPVRSQLLSLRVKELQHYLNQHNISTRGCVEKEDLVNVVLRYANVPGYNSAAQNNTSSAAASSAHSNSGSDSQFQSTSHQNVATQSATAVPTNDSDSSSTSSFEMVQKPDSSSSEENLGSGDSASSASTSSEAPPAGRSGTHSLPLPLHADPVQTTDSVFQGEVIHSSEIASNINVDLSASNSVEPSGVVAPVPIDQAKAENNSPSNLRSTMALISCEADLEALTVKQLKDMLVRNGVNYRGCCEKGELVDRAKVLYRDYHASRADLEKLELNELCKICMDAPVECVMLECGHMATCTQCGRQLNECPICRQYVVRIVRTFKA